MSEAENVKITSTQFLGNFENRTGRMIVSDPCYAVGIWCAAILENVQIGTWYAELGISDEVLWGKRVSYIEAGTGKSSGDWTKHKVDIGVDSGQMSISDYHDQMGTGDYEDNTHWYGKACNLTLGGNKGGIINFMGYNIAAVSKTGYGDGSYDLYTQINKDGDISRIRVVFIPKLEMSEE